MIAHAGKNENLRKRLLPAAALLLINYGLVVAWWYTKRTVSVFEVQTARAVHRALRSSLGYMRR
jgi:hypothetical protein